ncbi:hypothetical protein SKC42_21220 [Mycobacterium sp. 050134]
MLETVRQYALEKLWESGEADTAHTLTATTMCCSFGFKVRRSMLWGANNLLAVSDTTTVSHSILAVSPVAPL